MEIMRSDGTVEEVVELGNMRPHTVRRGLKEGQIEGTRLGSPPGDSVHEDDGLRPQKNSSRSCDRPRGGDRPTACRRRTGASVTTSC